jgi:NADH pyrophosphatase NudC (nudix superfamily)
MQLDLHIVLLGLLTLAVGYVMAYAGVQKSALEWRRQRRICPSCGRELRTRVCRVCTS